MSIGDIEKKVVPPGEVASPQKRGEGKRERDAVSGQYVSKLDEELVGRVTLAIRAGASLDTAAKYSGVAQGTMRRWLAEGRAALQKSPDPSAVEGWPEEVAQQVALVQQIDEAMAEFKVGLTGTILQASTTTWQAGAWLLERRFPDEFGRRQRIDHANADGEAFRVAPTPLFDPSKLSDEELEQWISLAEKARPDGLRDAGAMRAPEDLRALDA